jgi:RND family efflux transporter MFP subunit
MSDELRANLASLHIDREPARAPAGRGRFLSVVLWLALFAALGVGGVRAWPWIEARVFKTEVRVGEVTSVSPARGSTRVVASGFVVALTTARLTPRAAGRVARVLVREGARVQPGDVLLELDAVDQRAALASAQARVLSAQARVAVARANLAELRVQLERQRRLVATGVGPRSALEDLDARVGPLEASIAASLAEARALQAEVAALRVGLGQLVVRAPFAGVVLNRPPQVGEVLSPGQSPIELFDPTSLVLEVDVPEGRLSNVRVGGPCEVTLESLPGRRFRALVRELGQRVDRAKASVPVRVTFAEPIPGVLPEMSGRAGFLEREPTEAELRAPERVLLPSSAVTHRDGREVVFVVQEGAARERTVRLGAPSGAEVELLEGPTPGSRVVLSPPAALRDGSAVKEVR